MARAATITHINIYIGDTFRNVTRTREINITVHDHHFILVALIIVMRGTPMSAATTGLIPLNALMIYSFS